MIFKDRWVGVAGYKGDYSARRTVFDPRFKTKRKALKWVETMYAYDKSHHLRNLTYRIERL